jgi:hypothetical protein
MIELDHNNQERRVNMFNLAIETDNASFESYPQGELAWILRVIAERLTSGEDEGSIMDSNGNDVGWYSLFG